LRKDESSSMRGWQRVHCYTAPTSLNEYRVDLPPAANLVLQKAMAKNPHERYPTVQVFAVDLLEASQEITQLLVKPSLSVLSPVTRFRPLPGNVHANDNVLVKLQPARVSLATPPATDPIAIPIIPAPTNHASRRQEGKDKPSSHAVHKATAKAARSSNRWIWCALTLNVLICLVLIAEFTLQAGSMSFQAKQLLVFCPALLVGLLLALLFKRISLNTLSGGLFWGVVFGMTNALLSTSVCLACSPLLLVMPFQGSAGGYLNAFFSNVLTFVAVPHDIVFMLLALWMSIIGGAIIGIFNMQGEDAARISHPEPRKQSSR
jgi:hypothetical protein